MRKRGLSIAFTLMTVALVFPALGQMSLEGALGIFREDDVVAPFNDQGKAQLEAAIAAFKAALGVPDTLDEESEDQVGEFVVDLANKDIVNKLSQCYYTLANIFLTGKNQQLPVYKKGKAWGFKSLRMNPDFLALEKKESFVAAVKVENDLAALYWANSNWLRISEFDIMAAVRGRIPQQALAVAERTLELGPTYVCYGPYRSLGAFWAKIPSDPISQILMGGLIQDLPKSLSYFCQIVSDPTLCVSGPVDPSCDEYFENREFYAEFYLMEKKMYAEAKRVLQSIVDAPVGDKYPLYNAYTQAHARNLLENDKNLKNLP